VLSGDLQPGAGQNNIASRLAVTKIRPSLHDRSTSIEAVSAPISSLHRSSDLMAQRLFKEVAREPDI
jgi:hypothetical protein